MLANHTNNKITKRLSFLFCCLFFLINSLFWLTLFLKPNISIVFILTSCSLSFIYWIIKIIFELKNMCRKQSSSLFWKLLILILITLSFSITTSLFLAHIIEYEFFYQNFLTKEKIELNNSNNQWFYTSGKFTAFLLIFSLSVGICLYVWLIYFAIAFIASKKFNIKGLFNLKNSSKLLTLNMIIFIELLPIQIPLFILVFFVHVNSSIIAIIAPIVAMPLFLALSFCIFKARPKIENWIFEFIRLQ